nr:glutamate receptor 3.5-like [Arachis hypogaea]
MELLSITRHGNMMVLLLLVLWSCRWIPMQVSGRKGTTFADSTVDPKPNVSRIGALFTVNSVIGRTARPAILDAIDDVNANTSILPHTKLELILHDTDCSGFLGIAEGISQPFRNQL